MKKAKLPIFSRKIPGLSVMDRYIFIELFMPFLFGVGLFSSLGVAVGTLFELVRKVTESGLLIDVAIKVLILKMPEFIVLAFPMSVLLATLMAYSRLANDSETIALQSIGVSIYRIVLPGLIFSLFVTGLTFIFNDFVAPAANSQASVTLNQALGKSQLPFTERNIIYPEYHKVKQADGSKQKVMTRLFYAEEYDGQEMQGLTILDRSQAEMNQIITSQSAVWNVEDRLWDFFNGTIYLIAPDGSYRNIVRFQHQQISLPKAPLNVAKKCKDYGEMNIFEATECLNNLRLSGDEKKIRKLKVRIQEKFALPFVCLVFGFVGAALGVRPNKIGKGTSFGICVLVVFCYYLLAFISSSLGISGIFTPFMAAWLPNFIGLTVGGSLLVQSAR